MVSRGVLTAAVALAAACGRIGFDDEGANPSGDVDAYAEAAASAIDGMPLEPELTLPAPELALAGATDGSARGGLDRIASLLEEIEHRRERESRRSAT